jgi:hypothetical protein
MLRAAAPRTGKWFELKIGQRPAVPQRLRFTQLHRGPAGIPLLKRPPAIGHPLLERVQVQFAGLDAEQVPRRPGEQPRRGAAAGQRLAQPGDLHVQHRVGRPGRLIGEQLVDQLVAGDDTVGMTQQQPQQGPLPGPADPHRGAVDPDLQRPENAELHPTAHVTPHLLKSVPKSRGVGQACAADTALKGC